MKESQISKMTLEEIIILRSLHANDNLDRLNLARVLARNDVNKRSEEAWEHRIRRFIKKYPDWKKLEPDSTKVTEVTDSVNSSLAIKNRALELLIQEKNVELRKLKDYAQEQLERYETLYQLLPSLPLVKQVPIIGQRTKTAVERKEDIVVMISDAHINRVIDKDEMEGFNEYNFNIFANRYWHLLTQTVKIANAQRYEATIDTIHIDFLGDMFNDIYRDENKRTNEFSPVVAVLLGSYVLAQGLNLLTPHFKKVKVTGIMGNESRWDPKKPSKEKFNNMDYEAYHMMSMMLHNQIASGQMEFTIPVSPSIVIERQGKKFLLSHGDAVKSWGGFPAYGLMRDNDKQQRMRKGRGGFDFHEIGHFHQENNLFNQMLMNGSMCGTDEYALNELHVAGPPVQKIFGLREDHGITFQYDVRLDGAKENGFVYSTNHLKVEGLGDLWNEFLAKSPVFHAETALSDIQGKNKK